MAGNNRRYESDVVIVGGGIAGVVTALELLDHDRKVIIIDRDEESRFGGLARESFGGMMIVDSPQQRRQGIEDSPELAMADWLRTARFTEKDVWPRKWAEAYVNNSMEWIYDWLVQRSVQFLPVVNWAERGLHAPANTVPRWLITWGTGFVLTMMIMKQLKEHPKLKNLQLFFNHRVSRLDRVNGAVTGCSGELEGSGEEFAARADVVVVATGGIGGGDLSKARLHWPKDWGEPPATLLNGSHRYADGAVHDLVEGIGGSVSHLDRQWAYGSAIPHPNPNRVDHGLCIVPPRSALWVNAVGKRIGPVPLMANTDTDYIVGRICEQPGKYSWQVLNWKIAIKELAVSGSEYMIAFKKKSKLSLIKKVLFGNADLVKRLLRESRDFITADSAPELVDRMNGMENEYTVDPDLLQAEIKAYDDQIDRGRRFFTDEQLRRIVTTRAYRADRMRLCKFQKIDDPAARPLIAIREFISTRKSLGGVRTDLQSRVLDPADEPIPGLYAVGEAAGFGGGGICGEKSLEGTFLSCCILTGRFAAKSIAGKS